MKQKRLKTVVFGTAASLGTAMLLPIQEAAAQAQTAASAILEEVVVTARRREETLEDLPLSVVAISGEALQAQGIYNTRQIGDFAANVNLQVTDRSQVSMIHIRGIGGGFPNPIQVFGAGMYMDGHYLAGSLGNYMSTLDIERVEVLRGPQGTLFGKNVTGGAINIVSRKPQPEFESEVLLRAGSYGQQDLRAMANVPFSDNFFGRFSVANEANDGFYRNRHLGRSTDRTDGTSFRGAFRWEAGENWTIDATYLHYDESGGNTGMQCEVAIAPGVVGNLENAYMGDQALMDRLDSYRPYVRQGVQGVGQWGGGSGHIEKLYPGATMDMWQDCLDDNLAGEFVNSSEGPDSNKAGSDNLFLAAVWDSGGPIGGVENLQVRTNFSLRDSFYTFESDRDKTSLPVDSLSHVGGGKGFTQENTNLEMIFDATVSDRLNFLVGLYYFDDVANTGSGDCWPLWQGMIPQIERDLAPHAGVDPLDLVGTGVSTVSQPCGPGSGGTGLQFQFLPDNARMDPAVRGTPPGSAMQQVNTYTESKAVFGHMNYALTDDWDLELGARWTEDFRGFNIVEFPTPNSCNFRGDGLHCAPMSVLSFDNVMGNGFFNNAEDTFSKTTPMISLTRNLAPGTTLDNGIVYFLISQGFLTGSFNDEMNLFLAPRLEPLVGYGPETVTNYEVGFKGTLAGGRVRLNADIFLMDYQDKQEAVQIDNSDGRYGPDSTLEFTQNAASVNIYGIEFELRASPWDGGFVTLDFGYLIDEYDQFIVYDPDTDGPQDRSILNVDDRQPDWTVNASLGHTFTLANGGQLTPQFRMYSQGEYEWEGSQPRNGPETYCFQDAYSRWGTRVTYQPAAGNWEASLFGDNITDTRYFNYCDASRTGIFDHADGRPAWWGAEFVYRWGG